MDEFNETKAIVEQFLCLKLDEASTTSKMTSDLIKCKDQYLSRVDNNLTASQCVKKLADLPNDFMANEPKCIALKSSTDQGLSKVSLYIHRKQFQHFLHSVDDPKDWNLIVKVLNDLAEVAIDHTAVYGIDVIDDFVLTATDLIMNCPAQDGDSLYCSIRSLGGWGKFTANLTKVDCCSIKTKPWGLSSPLFGLCLICGKYWCRIDETCHETFPSYRKFEVHRDRFTHKTPTDFVKQCGRCGVEKDLERPKYNRCNNCSSYFCTAHDCSMTCDSSDYGKALRNHYRRAHNELIDSSQFLRSIYLTGLRTCCSADKKPLTKTVNDCGECENCGKTWCRINKSCKKSFSSAAAFRQHRQTKHDNPTNFAVQCSNCGLKKVRTEGLYRKCQCVKYHCNVEGCGAEYLLTSKLKASFVSHYNSCHPDLYI